MATVAGVKVFLKRGGCKIFAEATRGVVDPSGVSLIVYNGLVSIAGFPLSEVLYWDCRPYEAHNFNLADGEVQLRVGDELEVDAASGQIKPPGKVV